MGLDPAYDKGLSQLVASADVGQRLRNFLADSMCIGQLARDIGIFILQERPR